MNRRNFEIFGPTTETRYLLIGIVGIVLLVVAWFFMNSENPTAAVINEPANKLTGATAQEQQGQQEQQAQQEQQQQEEKNREYYTYSEQCAFDMKQRQDDITDTTTNKDNYQNELTALSEEYEQKKKELDEKYLEPTDRLKTYLERAQKEVDGAQQRYNEVKTICDQKQPE